MEMEVAREVRAGVNRILKNLNLGLEGQFRTDNLGRWFLAISCPIERVEYLKILDNLSVLFDKFRNFRMEWSNSKEEIIINPVSCREVVASGARESAPLPKTVYLYPARNGGIRDVIAIRKTSKHNGVANWVLLVDKTQNLEPLIHDSLVCLSNVKSVTVVDATTIGANRAGHEVSMLIFETTQLSIFDMALFGHKVGSVEG